MGKAYKWVARITLRDSIGLYDYLDITREEGNKLRKLKLANMGGSMEFPSLKNRLIDITHVKSIEDVYIEDVQQQIFESNDPDSGYKKFLAMKEQFSKKKR